MSRASELVIEPCTKPRVFLSAQTELYRDDPNFVPPLYAFDRAKVDLTKHPFFEHGEGALWVGKRGGRLVGRISASRDYLHDEYHGDRIGCFGHFEATDREVAHALLQTAADWLRAHGAEAMRGPIDFSTNYRCGLLIEGEPGTPFIMMPHNPLCYGEWIEGFGLQKAKDLVALHLTSPTLDLRRMDRMLERLLARNPVTSRMIDLKRFAAEVDLLWDLYNRIWERNWGFAPMSRAEFVAEAKDLRGIIRPELTVILERDGEPVAFALGVSDINLATLACRGRLLPFGWWRFLQTFRKVRRFRTLTLGVLPELRGTGTDAVLLRQLIAQGQAAEFHECEASWILEDNIGMLRPLLTAGGRHYRRYRIYERPLAGPAS